MSERGDKGFTSGECNLSVSKDSPFVEAVGAIDKFQARLGWTRVVIEEKEENEKILQIEKDLNEIMSSLYVGKDWKNGEKRIEEIESDSEEYEKRVKDLNDFLIPGENEVESRINICRTDCREAERRVVTLKWDREEKKKEKFDENVLKYFNKLSSFLNWMWRSKFN
ncbi:MAG: ATP:cob(I)alamin adenosyltransferase [Candidatus Shapirobacteria bacterium]|nr:ATP:cob(I)alamin adenosyltransferase [Candidatus Shapirobacteria bacterium]MDD3002600.1 ATP:cob(I)alamin adenosyltransferase [Candidatus Shapirobacteria bacterium]MDD4382797.1 ATP:cob(I)alamin adenosyltransferase [Candidatus Shapirobacteria bacterium]